MRQHFAHDYGSQPIVFLRNYVGGYLFVGLGFAPPAYMQTAEAQKQWLRRYPEHVKFGLEAAWAELACCGLRDAAALARRFTYLA